MWCAWKPGHGLTGLARELGRQDSRTNRIVPAAYLNNNRNKRGVTVNLKSDTGRKIAIELATQADIIVENFSAGVMERNRTWIRCTPPDKPRLDLYQHVGVG